MAEKFFPLPDNGVLQQNMRVANPTSHHVQCLHPLIIKHLRQDDEPMTAAKVVVALCAAIDEYAATFFPRGSAPTRVIKLMWLKSYIQHIVTERIVRVRALLSINSGYPNPAE